MSDLAAVFDLIDRITCLDIGRRGVAGLYEPARARNDEALCAAAARPLAGLSRGDHVIILTGSLTRSNVDTGIAENDGPMGVASLARAITHGFNAIPVIVVDESICDKVGAITRVAGPNVVTLEQARIAVDTPRFTSVAVVQGGHIDDAAARAQAREMIAEMRPKAVISVERAGLSADGTYRNARGEDYSAGRARLDHIVLEAARHGIATIGIGDGGNEIGMGAVREAVERHIPHGKVLCADIATDVLIPAGVSNWGCYGLVAALAVQAGNIDLAHTPDLERRLLEASPQIGLVDGTTGRLEPTADGLPLSTHLGLVELLWTVARRGIETGGRATFATL
jgi:D-glutamate cyclase